MEMLLNADRLIFTENDLFYGEIIRCRSAENFVQRYLKVRMDFKLTIIRVLDSRRERFRLCRPFCEKIDDHVSDVRKGEYTLLDLLKTEYEEGPS